MHKFITLLQKRLYCTLCTVHLIDANIATRDIPTYVSSCVLSLTTMIDHELPHINVLTKWDTLNDHCCTINSNDHRGSVTSTPLQVKHDSLGVTDNADDKEVFLHTSHFLDDEFDKQ
uniref:GPN-loop GTPase 2 n=1 Tax=Lygus hesperus TaxID=30085 RepID=A0A0A9VUV5_LYGHE